MKQKLFILAVLLFTSVFVVAQNRSPLSSDSAIARLKAGNKRFMEGKTIHPRQNPERIREVAKGQKPFAIIVGCADSRVPNEIIFDEGLGDLFIVRTAGQVSAGASYGSIEFAEAVLGANLIVVLGHTECGAVNAACNYKNAVPGNIITLVNAIKPAALKIENELKAGRIKQPDVLNATVRENVRMQVEQLRQLEPILAESMRSGRSKIVGAVYNLATGEVEFLPETLK
ncbi:MAG: carbonic anhydrase [Chloroherpetonaceae bacterium]|nr:carbonic anhydrase [Chloroherpetonaceae bacterium]